MPLDGKVAIVTGSGAGLGRSIAQCCAREGAQVVVSDIDDARGAETVQLITEAGGSASYRHADTSSPDDSEKLVRFAMDTDDHLDIACNNAGIAPPSTPLAEVSTELWRRTLQGAWGAR